MCLMKKTQNEQNIYIIYQEKYEANERDEEDTQELLHSCEEEHDRKMNKGADHEQLDVEEGQNN